MNNNFSIKDRLKSFHYAYNGIRILIRSQHNAWIHSIATITAIFAGLFFRLSNAEWCWIVLAIIAVWVAEAFNTAFEFLADAVTQERQLLIQKAKDTAAAGVLIAAVGSVIIAIFVFGPHLF